jgi:hypothetical protein
MKKQLEQIAAEFWQKVKNNEYSIIDHSGVTYFDYLQKRYDFFALKITVGDLENVTIYVTPNDKEVANDVFGLHDRALHTINYTPEWYEFLVTGIEAMEMELEENHKQFKIKNDL